MSSSQIGIAFAKIGGSDGWRFGTVYLEDLFQALRTTCGDKVSLYLLAHDRDAGVQDSLARLVDETIAYPRIRRWTPLWVVDVVCRRLLGRDLIRDLALRRQGVKAIAFGEAPKGSKLPTLDWFWDFQFVHLPEIFSEEDRRHAIRDFRKLAKEATRVLLWSESVSSDFKTLAPESAHKARVVSPVCYVPPSVYERNPKSVCDIYHLPEKFVYIPNQFWKHKNHATAFQALAILKDRGVEMFLVCSGYPGDFRHPSHFADTLRDLSQRGVRSQVALLGLLPREEVLKLMRQSVCVINPSLFEGYGMAAEEARSVGKSVLLSDLASHREQNPPQSEFFDPRDPEDLAGKLEQVWRGKSPGPDTELESEARQCQPIRLRRYAESFIAVVEELIGE